jgi:hypothetical protein
LERSFSYKKKLLAYGVDFWVQSGSRSPTESVALTDHAVQTDAKASLFALCGPADTTGKTVQCPPRTRGGGHSALCPREKQALDFQSDE